MCNNSIAIEGSGPLLQVGEVLFRLLEELGGLKSE